MEALGRTVTSHVAPTTLNAGASKQKNKIKRRLISIGDRYKEAAEVCLVDGQRRHRACGKRLAGWHADFPHLLDVSAAQPPRPQFYTAFGAALPSVSFTVNAAAFHLQSIVRE